MMTNHFELPKRLDKVDELFIVNDCSKKSMFKMAVDKTVVITN